MVTEAKITLILPYFNEEEFLAESVQSLLRQDNDRFVLILVDNGSLDKSAQIAQDLAGQAPPGKIILTSEQRAGKIFALRAGVSLARTEFVGTVDADTVYPTDYVAKTLALFEKRPDAVAVVAVGISSADKLASDLARARLKASLFRNKCQSGGCGQSFRRVDLEAVGGFDARIWPFILEDHEIMVRVGQRGRIVHGWDHVCFPSDRRSPGQPMGWTLSERLIYQLIPVFALNWYFHSVLAKRFKRRKLGGLKLRDRPWEDGAA